MSSKDIGQEIEFSQKTQNKIRAYLSLMGQFGLSFVTGDMNLYGTCSIYFVSYLRKYKPDLIISYFMLPTNVNLFLSIIVSLIAIRVGKIIGQRITILLAILIISFGNFLAALQTNWLLFQLCYSLMQGIVQVFIILIPLYLNWLVFPKQKGLVGSVMSLGRTFAGWMLNIISLYIMNPDNLQPTILDKQDSNLYFSTKIADRVPILLFVLGSIYLSVGLISTILIYTQHKFGDRFMTHSRNFSLIGKILGNLTCGMLIDKFKFKSLFFIISTSLLIFHFSLPWALQYQVTYAIWLILIEFLSGGIYPMVFATSAKTYGITIASHLSGVIRAAIMITILLILYPPSLFNALHLSYDKQIYIYGVFTIINLLLGCCYDEKNLIIDIKKTDIFAYPVITKDNEYLDSLLSDEKSNIS